MLSVIATGRDDNYEGGFIDRLMQSVETNCKNLNKLGIEYEYAVVEWNPLSDDKWLGLNPTTKHIFQNEDYNLYDIVIKESVVLAEKLNPKKYYEYFAKNAGLRWSQGKDVLVINSDIILEEPILRQIKELHNNGLDPKRFYRARYRNNVDLHQQWLPDAHVCGSYSGDFLLVDGDVMRNQVKGYDETNPNHRIGYQTAMDGEILFHMLKLDMKMKFIEENYTHIDHPKTRSYDSGDYNQGGYNNPEDWGFLPKYNLAELDNIHIVHNNE